MAGQGPARTAPRRVPVPGTPAELRPPGRRGQDHGAVRARVHRQAGRVRAVGAEDRVPDRLHAVHPVPGDRPGGVVGADGVASVVAFAVLITGR